MAARARGKLGYYVLQRWELERIEKVEQSDRSTTVRKLLYRAVGEWKKEYYARRYGEGKITLARATQEAGLSLWEMMSYVRETIRLYFRGDTSTAPATQPSPRRA